jgi:hypothetical protein
MTVRDSRINGDENSGDILFSALVILDDASAIDITEQLLTISRQVHCLDQIVDVVVQQGEPLQVDTTINLWHPMKDTGVWREGAQLDNIVALAIGVLSIYQDAPVPGPAVMANVLVDFEEIWLHMIAPVFETVSQSLGQFSGGGWLYERLLGGDLYRRMAETREQKKIARGQGSRAKRARP